MELKVWMDGIQRVVSGASFDTTCRDVVLVLAQAMGRTGRFTLVEKWRESERPLTPAECPLMSLHKWGEYAKEVKFYLIQAERDKHKTLKRGNHKDGKLDEYISKNSQGYVYANTPGNDSLKRSLTFSGVNPVGYASQPSSNYGDGDASSFKGPVVQGHGQKIMNYSASSADNSSRGALQPLSNGDSRLANNSSNQHAFQSSLEQVGRYDPTKPSPADMSSLARMNRGDGKKVHPDLSHVHMAHSVQNNRGDSREIHPANMPGSTSPYQSSQATPQQKVLYPVPSHQRVPLHHPPQASSQPQFQSHIQSLPKTNVHSVDSQKLNINASSSSQGPMPANRQIHQTHTVQEPRSHSDGNLKPQLQQSSSQPLSTFGHHQPYQPISSQHLTQHNSRPQTKQRPLPAPRHTQNPLPAAFEYPNVSSQGKIFQTPQPRQRSRERIDSSRLGQTPEQQIALSEQIKSSNFFNAKRPILDDSFYSKDDNDNKFPKPTGLRYAPHRRLKDDYKQSVEVTDNANANNNSQSSMKITENAKQPPNSTGYAYKSSTLERSVPRQTKAIPGPARSLSTGETDDSKPGTDPPASADLQIQTSPEGSKLSFVDSALMKQSRINTDVGKAGAVSTFASAVAHLRQRSADGTFKPSVVSHVRQHSSDSGHGDAALLPGKDPNRTIIPSAPGQNVASLVNPSAYIASPTSETRYNRPTSETQYKQPTTQPHIPPSSTSLPAQSFSPISSRLSSAFKEVSPRANSGAGAQSHMAAPSAYGSSQPSFSTFGIGVPPVQAPTDGKHSRQPSVEIEEYDLDQNFHDFSHRDPGGGVGSLEVKNLNIPLEYSLDSGNVTPAKSEAEYLQLVRLIKMQEERLQMQDAKIHDTEMEISTLETQESQNQSSKDALSEELSRLEKTELEGKQELLELEKGDWGNVINVEKQTESSIKSQMVKIKERIEEMENKLKKLQEEEERLNKELKAEKESVESKKAKMEEGEKITASETSKIKDELSQVNKTLQERENKVKELEDFINWTEEDINSKEKKVETMTKEIDDDSSDDAHNLSVTTESTSLSPASRSPNLSASDNGEAILKILEGRLSPHPGLDGIQGEGLKSAHSKLKSPLATKNPNGVWV